MATTIKSPQEGYNGTDTYGPLTLEFKDGVATTDETLSAGHKAYFKKLGFKVASVKSDADKAKAEADAKADAKSEAERKAKEEADKQAEADAKAAAEKKEGDK
ncbi:hypothetical protein [Glutamicibacter nicotianae]|uniref:hypothetical protein n=1 Tax=Glutamicibacter nicotianae TaxID=37929 RepID=UPI001ABFADB6|nr:hypothetical protein [Glutamicibacter nicotianae]